MITNAEFAERFYAITDLPTFDSRVAELNLLLKDAKSSLQKQIIISSDDVYDLGRRVLEGIIHEAVYNCVDGTFLIVSYKDYSYTSCEYFCYKGAWISTSDLYNVIKGSMNRNLDKLSSCYDTYKNIIYILSKCEIRQIYLLE